MLEIPLRLEGLATKTAMSDKLPFKPFSEHAEVRMYYNGFLPHWRQAGCTYFVTFRLADSVPQRVLDEWRYDRDNWLAGRGIDTASNGWTRDLQKLSCEERRLFERRFAKKLFECLDEGHGACHLRNAAIATTVADAMTHFHGSRLDTGDFVIMPNHVHALVTPYSGYELEDVLHSVKSFTANRINMTLGQSGTLWMNESHDHIVRDGAELLRIQEYIRRNPEKAHLQTGEFLLREAEYELK